MSKLTLMSATALLAALFLGGCATSPSPQAARIIEADEQMVRGCKFLGHFRGYSGATGVFRDTGAENSRAEVLNKAAARGATHIVWLHITADWYNPSAEGRAYLCK